MRYRKYVFDHFPNNLSHGVYPGDPVWGIPYIHPEPYVECRYIRFEDAVRFKDKENAGCMFFCDDFKFERIWYNLPRYAEMLRPFKAVIAPDYSMFTDWPRAVCLFNLYRRHYVSAYLQDMGVRVYPAVGWSDESSYSWCFNALPRHSTVAVSSMGTQLHKDTQKLFLKGWREMMRRVKPETILFCGTVPRECEGNIVTIEPYYMELRRIRPKKSKKKEKDAQEEAPVTE